MKRGCESHTCDTHSEEAGVFMVLALYSAPARKVRPSLESRLGLAMPVWWGHRALGRGLKL